MTSQKEGCVGEGRALISPAKGEHAQSACAAVLVPHLHRCGFSFMTTCYAPAGKDFASRTFLTEKGHARRMRKSHA